MGSFDWAFRKRQKVESEVGVPGWGTSQIKVWQWQKDANQDLRKIVSL